MPPPENRGNTEDNKARCPLDKTTKMGFSLAIQWSHLNMGDDELPFSWTGGRTSLLMWAWKLNPSNTFKRAKERQAPHRGRTKKKDQEVRKVTLNECTRTNLHKQMMLPSKSLPWKLILSNAVGMDALESVLKPGIFHILTARNYLTFYAKFSISPESSEYWCFSFKVLPAFSSRADKCLPKQSLYFLVRAAVALDWSCWFIYQSLTTL